MENEKDDLQKAAESKSAQEATALREKLFRETPLTATSRKELLKIKKVWGNLAGYRGHIGPRQIARGLKEIARNEKIT